MPDASKPAPGQVAWIDLTVPNAEAVRDFYQQVTGWTASSVDMGGYADYCMSSAAGNMVAGICHARGVNAELPPVWMVSSQSVTSPGPSIWLSILPFGADEAGRSLTLAVPC
jgi:predicted enzyme related to lactoylglutathione lyase